MNGLPAGWSWVRLKELASEMCLGKMLDKKKNQGTLKPYLRNVNVRWSSFDLTDLKEMRFKPGEGERYGLLPGDLVICEGGEPGRAAVWAGQSEDARIQKALHRVRFDPAVYLPHFAMYYLYFATSTDQLASYYTGTTIKHLTGKSLAEVPFPHCPPAEQRRIVAKIEELFSDLDAGVAALERAKANLKRYRAAVLKAAVEGKLTAQWRAEHPDVEPADQLLARILAERRQKWQQDQLAKYEAKGKKPPKNWKDKYKPPAEPDTTNLPDLPEGWCWASVGQIGNVQLGRQRSPKNRSKDYPTQYIRAANITESGLDLSDVLDMEFRPEEAERYRLRAGDIVLSEASGSPDQVGKPALWRGEMELCCFQNTVIRLRPCLAASDYILTVFLHYYTNSVFAAVAGGVGINHLSAARFSAMPFPLAPQEEQSVIVAETEETLSRNQAGDVAITKSLVRATRLRQAILKRAFEGKLVPQDPTDEPASVLLDRIKAERDAAAARAKSAKKKARKRKGKKR